MQPLAQNGYTEQEVLDALRGKHGTRQLSFRYDLLDRFNAYQGRLDNVLEVLGVAVLLQRHQADGQVHHSR